MSDFNPLDHSGPNPQDRPGTIPSSINPVDNPDTRTSAVRQDNIRGVRDDDEGYDAGVMLALEQYGAALSNNDLEAIAASWDVPAYVIDAQGARTVESAEQVREFFAAAVAAYHARGIVRTHAHVRRIEPLGDGLYWVQARWPGFDLQGHEIWSESGRWLLSTGADGKLRIRVYVGLSADRA